mmetsp:Transcript_36235/g.111648  ORF Transcript_36235/g.111648 Transcript_36235/m.111648 type:complete len:202 (-) Transcript_36235:1630-2235(-)
MVLKPKRESNEVPEQLRHDDAVGAQREVGRPIEPCQRPGRHLPPREDGGGRGERRARAGDDEKDVQGGAHAGAQHQLRDEQHGLDAARGVDARGAEPCELHAVDDAEHGGDDGLGDEVQRDVEVDERGAVLGLEVVTRQRRVPEAVRCVHFFLCAAVSITAVGVRMLFRTVVDQRLGRRRKSTGRNGVIRHSAVILHVLLR